MPPDQIKRADPDHPVHDLIAARWSPYVYQPKPVEPRKLRSCLEAARWAASSFNEQPWSFILAVREDEAAFEKLLGCLLEANQAWAKDAGVLLLTVVSRFFSKNGKPNRVAEHDLGLAAGNLTLQATALGLHVHQMAGINPAHARQAYAIPEGQDPYTAIAIGYAGEPASAPAQAGELAQRDLAPRQRKALGAFVYGGQWGRTAPLAGE